VAPVLFMYILDISGKVDQVEYRITFPIPSCLCLIQEFDINSACYKKELRS
jgi:hypothetical protein